MSRNTLIYILLASLTLINCGPVPEEPTVNGLWRSPGSGWVLEVKDSTNYAFYDITPISCLPNRQGPFEELSGSIEVRDNTLLLKKGVITYTFQRIEELPTPCQRDLGLERYDPLFNFEVFAQTVREHYAFMDMNHINWDSLYAAKKEKLSLNPNDIALYNLIDETLMLLKDNHAYLEADDTLYEALENAALGSLVESEVDALPQYGDFQVADMVASHHLEEDLTNDSWLIKWGRLSGGIGYMQVKAMWLFGDLEVPQQLIEEVGYVDAYVATFHQMYEGAYIEQEVLGVSHIMDRVMEDLQGMNSIVIDLRFNGGGQDAVSFEILSRFISGKLQVATQQLKYGKGYTPVLPLYIKGSGKPYNKPVYVLTSPQTGSAAEAFAIATMAMPNVQRIGSATAGAMSTALEKTLPNGWAFSISNEVYMDTKGTAYENKGIPVDYDLNYPRERQPFFRMVVDDLEGDKRQLLDAIKSLEEGEAIPEER